MGAVTKIDLLMDRLVVEPVGWHKVWSLRRRIDVPYADIVSVAEDHRLAENGPSGVRFPGASLPGIYLAGTFWKFWGERTCGHSGCAVTPRTASPSDYATTTSITSPSR
ncbi:MAG: hypothetical protein QM753_00155 [Thermomicrobiales bacterium]